MNYVLLKFPYVSFLFDFISGCIADIIAESGSIMSPGFGVLNYPSFQECTWTIAMGSIMEMKITVDELDLYDTIDTLEVSRICDISRQIHAYG